MNIAKYQDYFHDGIFLDIVQKNDAIEISMISCVMLAEDLVDDIMLSYDKTIRGKLHLEKVKSIMIDNHLIHGNFNIVFDRAEILDLEVKDKKVKINLIWKILRSKNKHEGFSSIIIQAEKIYWENIPNLLDPYEFTEPSLPEYKSRTHYHHLNAATTGKHDKYFDQHGNTVPQGSLASWLIPKKFTKLVDIQENKYIPEIPVSKYWLEFHDGNLIDINQSGNNIILSISSAEIQAEIKNDLIPLSGDKRIKGKLHLDGVTKILRNGKYEDKLKMRFSCGNILFLQFKKNGINIYVKWENYLPSFKKEKSDEFEIEAQKIYWEPIPDLIDPYW